MSSTNSPRPSITSERLATNNQATPTLPSKFRVPPLPPRIHRRLYLSLQDDGLLITSTRKSTGGRRKDDVLVGYGPKGQVRRCGEMVQQAQQQRKQRSGNSVDQTIDPLEIGGILGLTRLWETAYLIIFLAPPRSTSTTTTTSNSTSSTSGMIKIFPPEVKNEFPNLPLETPNKFGDDTADPLIRGLRAIAEREGLLSPDGRLNAYSPRSTTGVKHGNPDEDHERNEDDEEKDEGQGVVFELRNVYAVPLNKEGAEGIIRGIQAGINKDKPRPSANTVPSTPGPSTNQPIGDLSLSSSRASLDPADREPAAETPAQVLARALNPANWNLGIPKKGEGAAGTGARRASSVKEVNEEVNQVAAGAAAGGEQPARQSYDGSGDIGESMVIESEDHLSAVQTQKGDKATGEGHFDDQAGLPQPEEVMAKVPETRLKEEGSKRTSFMDGLKADWGKMFGKTTTTPAVTSSSKSAPDQAGALREEESDEEKDGQDGQRRLDAKVPGVLGAEGKGETEVVNVEDGEVRREEAEETGVPGSRSGSTTAGAGNDGQRKNLEIKIVREIVRTLGGGGFFYSFETDLSHNLQHKRKQLDTRHQSSGILGSLLQKEEGARSPLPLAPTEPVTPEGDLSESMLEESAVPPPSQGQSRGLAAAAEIVDKKDPVTLARERQERGETWVEPDVGLPLWRRVDQRFMWNAWMMRDFIDAGLHEFILPVIQGWVQSSRFYIPPVEATPSSSPANLKSPVNNQEKDLGPPSTPVDLVLISRRSRDRAGLRFQRRGIDEEGNVANFVETEMIIRVKVEGKWSIFSFVQIRGSIPLFWSQSSTLTDMKPAPKLDRPVAQTTGTTRLHFDHLTRKYGPQTIINLAETSGKEGSVTLGYRDVVKDLDDKDVRYVEFDFHHECKGMKYENISKLINQLGSTFSEQGYFWSCQGEVMREQTGSFRVNCIDCLDRTNVVESALARHILTSQLTQVGMTPDVMTSNIDFVYNDAWANNGDQISKLYAGTSALKGDFTRTGKRDLHGMINDGLNSVARMRRGAIEDFYLQAVISFMVGERNLTVFSEVLSNLASTDRTNLMRLSRIRAAAIETCTARVLEEGEHRVCGWTVFSPEEANAKFTRKMEEKVLILTPQALYVVSFDYNLEKVVSSTRVPLRNITSMSKGAYILSALEESGRDPAENAGFVVHYRPAKTGTRITSYSMANALESSSRDSIQDPATPSGNHELFAFKVLPREFVAAHLSTGHPEEDEDDDRGKDETCRDVTERMVRRIRDECVKATASVGGYVGGHAREDGFVRDEDVVGLAEAQKATSLVARADYALKRFLWMP